MSEEKEGDYQQAAAQEPEVLNVQQINNAKIQISNTHPLSRIPLLKALPFLRFCKCCLKKPKKDFRLAVRKALLRKMDLKMPKSDIQLEQDPFLRLGFGMGAYFETLVKLMYAYLLITLFVIPTMGIFVYNMALYGEDYWFITMFSLGNMGGANYACKNYPSSMTSIDLYCDLGVIDTSLMTEMNMGLIIETSDNTNFCLYDSEDEDTANCISYLNTTYILANVVEECEGKETCTYTFADDADNFITSDDDTVGYQEYCIYNDYAIFYIQYGCIFNTDTLNYRQVQGLYVGCIGVFVALFFAVFADYLSSVFKNAFVEWDVKTITAGDYSCELTISQEMWDNFVNEHYNQLSGKTKISAFRDHLQAELEERLTRLPDLGYEDPPPERIKLAMISFAFDNAELILMLRERGTAIKFEKYSKVREIDKKIDELKSESSNIVRFNRPVTAFLTFENEEGINRCKEYNEAVENDNQYNDIRTFLGEKLQIDDAAEPTDIIWENRHFTTLDRFKRAVIVICVVCILLSISFVLIYICSFMNAQKVFKWPSVDCDTTFTDFGSDTSILEVMAFKEYFYNRDSDGNEYSDSVCNYQAYLQCFCEQMSSEGDSWSTTYVNPLSNYGVYGDSYSICYGYNIDYWIEYAFSYTVSFVIVIINSILRSIMIKLIKWIGEDTHSAQLRSIANGVFVTLFFNTGFLTLLAYANFSEVKLPFYSFFDNYYYDYTTDWYTVVGYKMTQTMAINAFFMYIEFGMAYGQLWFFRRQDRNWQKDEYITKKTSMQLYVDLYSGPEYFIHFKYSGILNVIFVTFMYGLGVPVMFLLAALYFFNLYALEKVTVAYFYQLPPTFDDQMTKNCVAKMRWGVLFLLFFGYWMLSNKQIFQNQYSFIAVAGDLMYTNHTFSTISIDQASPMLLMGCAIFVMIFMQAYFKKLLKRWGFSFGGYKINVDENLPFFFTALRLSDADWLIKENENLRDKYGFEIISQEVSNILDVVKPPKKSIQGVPFYIILSNPAYFRDFQYICCDVPDRATLIKDDDDDEENDCEQSDIVALILNLAYIPEYVAEGFHFQSGFSKTFMQAVQQQKVGEGLINKIADKAGLN